MTRITLGSLDDRLGARQARYFGDGYRQVRHRLQRLRYESASARLIGDATVQYGRCWSVKGQQAQGAHLSSVDAIVLAAALAEGYLRAAFALDDEDLAHSWVSRIDVRAGAQPLTDLQGFEVTCERAGDAVDAGTVFDCRIGPLNVRLEIAHRSVGLLVREGGAVADVVFTHGVYGDLHKRSGLPVHSVSVDRDSQQCVARVTAATPEENARGLEAAFRGSARIIDAVVLVAQMAQVLLYEMDGLTRAESETLWMRRITISVARPMRPIEEPLNVEVRTERSRVVDMRSAGTWRVTEFALTDLAGISGVTSVAHQIDHAPDRSEAVSAA